MWTEVPGGVAFLSDRFKKYRETFYLRKTLTNARLNYDGLRIVLVEVEGSSDDPEER